MATEIAPVVGSGVVVDSTNPLNATNTEGVSGAADLQALLPAAKVVKAFNTVFASRHAAPTENGESLDLYIAGDDADARATVAELGASLGFRPLDVGGLRMARSLEELAFLNITLNATNGWVWQTARRLVGPTTGQ